MTEVSNVAGTELNDFILYMLLRRNISLNGVGSNHIISTYMPEQKRIKNEV